MQSSFAAASEALFRSEMRLISHLQPEILLLHNASWAFRTAHRPSDWQYRRRQSSFDDAAVLSRIKAAVSPPPLVISSLYVFRMRKMCTS